MDDYSAIPAALIGAGWCRLGTTQEAASRLAKAYSGYGPERYSPEMPEHRAWLDAYEIDVFPVTVGQYAGAVEAGVVAAPLLWEHPNFSDPQQPVVGVNWFEAMAFARWLGADLPSEAQWEKAASWDPKTSLAREYPWGEDWQVDRCLNAEFLLGEPITGRFVWQERFWDSGIGLSRGRVEAVGNRDEDASPYGIRMMAGHVWEWTRDVWDPNAYTHRDGSRNPCTTSDDPEAWRTVRGGSWVDDRNSCRCSYRTGSPPEAWRFGPSDIGFRCVWPAKLETVLNTKTTESMTGSDLDR